VGTVTSSSGSSLSSMFQVSGLASGIDTASIVSKLMQLEQRPLTKLQDAQTKLQNRKIGLTDISTKLSTLRTAASTLMLSTATQTRSASSTNTAVATATASANTSLQSFTVNVSQLATRTTMTSGAAIGAVIDGTTTISALPSTNLTTGSGTITVGIRNATTGVIKTKEITVQASDQLDTVRQSVQDALNLDLLPSGGATSSLSNGQMSFVAPAGYELIFGGPGDTSNVFSATNLATATADTTATGSTTLVEAGWNYMDPSTGSVALSPTLTMTLTPAGGGSTTTATINVGTSDTINDIVASINTYLQGATNYQGSPSTNVGGLGLTNATATFSNGRITVSNYNGSIAFGSDGTQYGNSLVSALKLPTTATGSPAASSGDITTTKRTYTASSAATTVSSSATLDSALGLTGSSEFRLNGTVITWDAATDTISSIVTRINSSGAGVLASFDSLTGKMSLQNRTTGATGISIDDNYGNGNFDLTDALKLTTNGGNSDAPVTSLGQNARYSINGGAFQSSTSNTVTRAITGVTLNLTGTLNTTATISIGQDTTAAVANVKTFVTAYNDALKWVQDNTKVDAATKTRADFAGDAMIEGIMTRLRAVVNTAASGLTTTYKSLPSIGLSSGAVGSAVGTTSSLVLDETKFTEALTSNPEAVQNLFGLSGGPLDSLKSYLISATSFSGMLNSSQTSADTQLRDLDRRITDMQSRLDQKQAALQKKYSDLEATLSKLQAQSSSLSQQLAGLSKNN
jgi:flagellar hook-associated protein 2